MNTLPMNEEMFYALDGSFTYLRELRLFFSCFKQIACSLTKEKIDLATR